MAFEHTLIQVRERRYLEVLDLALVVVRSRPLVLGQAALLGMAPVAAFNGWLLADPEFPLPLYLFLVFLEIPWATAPLTLVLGRLMFGQRIEAGRLLRELLHAFPMLFVYQLLLRPFLLLNPSRLVFLNEAILLERDTWVRTLGRSAKLCARRGGDIFLQGVAQVIFGFCFVFCFSLGTQMAISALTTSEMTWEEPGWSTVYSLRVQLALWLVIGFFAVARFLSYIDHRIRREGWEIELRLRDASRVLEEAEAW